LTIFFFREFWESGLILLQNSFGDINLSRIVDIILGRNPNQIYQWVPLIHTIVIYGYIIISLVFLLFLLKSQSGKFRFKIRGAIKFLGANGLFLIISLFILALFMYVISFGWLTESMRERALFLFIANTSALIGYITYKLMKSSGRRFRRVVSIVAIWLIVISLIYPIMSSHNQSYASFPDSENSGLTHLSSKVDVNGRNLSMIYIKQLSSYYFSSIDIRSVDFPPATIKDIEIITFRKTEYFNIAMTKDKSFEDNSYFGTQILVGNNHSFDKIYSSNTFEIFQKGATS
jgi:hypothetical protein